MGKHGSVTGLCIENLSRINLDRMCKEWDDGQTGWKAMGRRMENIETNVQEMLRRMQQDAETRVLIAIAIIAHPKQLCYST